MENALTRHKDILAILAMCLPLYFVRSWEGSLTGDPLRYVAIAKTMADTGNWMTLQDQPGVFYANKPPLMFWLIAASFKVFGVHLWAAKLWSALFATASAVMVYLLGRRLLDRHVALAAAVMSVTCIYAVSAYSTVRLESAVTLVTVIAAYAVVRAAQDERPAWLLVIGLAAGLGAMTKQVAALHVYAIAVIAIACLARRLFKSPYLYASLAIAVAIWAPWHVALIWTRGGEFTRIYFEREVASRILTGPHFFGGLLRNGLALLVGGLPWTIGYAVAPWRARNRTEPFPPALAAFFGFWVLEVAVTMAFPSTRYDRYMVTAYPAVVFPIAWLLVNRLPAAAREAVPRWLIGTAVAASVAMLILPVELHRWRYMEVIEARVYLDEFMPGQPAVYLDPTSPSGISEAPGQWAIRAGVVYYIGRPLFCYASVDEIEAKNVPLVFVRDAHSEALTASGWKRLSGASGRYQLFENPRLEPDLGADAYAERMQSVMRALEELGDKPIL
jgi:4-amino-4-deoxy-L-arabinose transferase-like glycosyltransferase